jgi:NAD(P)-dependent dehydrogenase (short-subunit alcohol dehydrogenase family)
MTDPHVHAGPAVEGYGRSYEGHEDEDHEHGDHERPPHAVIVGVGPGLGASLARVFAENGHDLTLIARSASSTAPVAAELSALGRRVLELHVDVSDLEGLADVIGQASSWQPITRLHHNASRNAGGLLEADATLLRLAIAVNALAPIAAVQAALPDLRAAHGTVTWTGAGAALNPSPDYGVLSQGKAALRAAAFALAPELAAQGVRLRMITVRGSIAAGGPLDPDRIAAALWAHSVDPDAPVELQFDGRS